MVSVPDPEDYQNFEQGWNRGALAWETGTGPSALIHGLASLKLLLETGPHNDHRKAYGLSVRTS